MNPFLSLLGGGRKKAAPTRATYQPTLEMLEDRRTPALIAGDVAPLLPVGGIPAGPGTNITADEVNTLLQRAAAATQRDDAIVAILDRGGNLLGVRVEGNVDPAIRGDPAKLTFAIDGAMAEARTAAFFANNTAPLTSRTIRFISQTTITQREVESNPSIPDPNSTVRGPGFVAPIGLGGHFPPNIPFTPQVDLFSIEGTNRDTLTAADGTPLPFGTRFNVNPLFIPAGKTLTPPLSYGAITGLQPNAQPRGIGTLPGGVPIFKNGTLVGGIGVFFPGKTGFADEENSSLNVNFDPTKPDLALQAEFIAFAATGGSSGAGYRVGALGGVAAPAGFDIPFGRIDLVGVTLDTIGPGGLQGPENLVNASQSFGVGLGDPNSGGPNQRVTPAANPPNNTLDGMTAPDGWLVTPHAGVGISATEVQQIINQGINAANTTRAQIRLPLGERTRMVFAVADSTGAILGLFRMQDATVFSIQVAVAKARNVAYYDDPAQIVTVDQVATGPPGPATLLPPGTSLTNRTFRYLALPFFPEGIDGKPPGPFSILNDPGTDPRTGLNTGAPLPASAFTSILGRDAFNPNTNFHDPNNLANQSGIVFFPGSSGVYKNVNGQQQIVGGFGVSGDGVDEDDVVTSFGINGFASPANIRADQAFVKGVRLPYQKFDRNPLD